MKKIVSIICLAAFTILLSGCVNRTVTNEDPNRPSGRKSLGADPNAKVLEERRVWVWQSEFRNP